MRGLAAALALSYVIYVPVSAFRSTSFLLVIDACILVALLSAPELTRLWEREPVRARVILAFAGVYLVSVALTIAAEDDPLGERALAAGRNLVFGMGVFGASLGLVTNGARLRQVLKPITVGTALAASYGVWQLIFGYTEFERARLAMMGGTLREFETLGRQRVVSTFGDPLACGVFMMVGVFAYGIARREGVSPILTRVLYPITIALTMVVLVLTLTRAPLLGALVGMSVALIGGYRRGSSTVTKACLGLAAAAALVVGVRWAANSAVLERTESRTLTAVREGARSAASLVRMLTADETERQEMTLSVRSSVARVQAWREAGAYLRAHPLGAGLTSTDDFSFARGDVGLLKLGLQIGTPGMFAMFALLLSVAAWGWRDMRRMQDGHGRETLALLLGAWVALLVTQGVTSVMDNAIVATVAWTMAGAIVNNARILGGGRVRATSREAGGRQTREREPSRGVRARERQCVTATGEL